MSKQRFESSLSTQTSRALDAGLAIELTETTDRGMIDLRGDLSDKAFADAAKKVLGVDLPDVPRSSAVKGDIAVLWLSVDQWLICCPRDKTDELLDDLRAALGATHSLAVDLSDARAIIRLQGAGVREILMKGAPVDLLAPDMTKGTVRRLRFGEIAAMVHFVDDRPDTIDLYVFRSYAEFAWDWLIATARKSTVVKLFGQQDAPPV